MTLRDAIAAVALVAFACLVLAMLRGIEPWPMLVPAGLLVGGILFERQRYRAREGAVPGAGMRPTPERFVDPASGRPTRVWVDATGARHYVEERAAGGPPDAP